MKILILLVTSFFPVIVFSKTLTYGNLKLDANGYVGYKYIHSTAKNDDIKSEPELGLILSSQLTNNISAYTQFMYSENIDTALVYSFLSYDKLIADDLQIGIKAGKLRHDYGLYNVNRINPQFRPGIIVPQPIYWDSLKYLITSGTGINFNIKWHGLELGYTIDEPTTVDPKAEAKVWTATLLNSVQSSFGSHQLATIKYTFDDIPLMIKGSWTDINLGNDNSAIMKYVFPQYATADQENEIATIGFETSYKNITFSSEAMALKPFFAKWTKPEGWAYGTSTTIKYEVNNNISIYSNYNFYHVPLPNAVEWYKNTTDVSVGINYHQKNWMIGAEVHHINGGKWVQPNNFFANPNDYKDWYMVGVNFAYFF